MYKRVQTWKNAYKRNLPKMTIKYATIIFLFPRQSCSSPDSVTFLHGTKYSTIECLIGV